MYLFIHLFVYLFVYLFIYLCVYLVYLFIYLICFPNIDQMFWGFLSLISWGTSPTTRIIDDTTEGRLRAVWTMQVI